MFDEKFYGLDRAMALKEKSVASFAQLRKFSASAAPAAAFRAILASSTGTPWLGITQSMFLRSSLHGGERQLMLELLLKNAKL